MTVFLTLKSLDRTIVLQIFPTFFQISFRTVTTNATLFPYGPYQTFKPPLTSLQCGSILQILTNSRSLIHGQALHAHMNTAGILQNNTYVSIKLVAFYANCGRMDEARVIFDQIIFKNSFLWNSMIRGYASSANPMKAIAMYRQMVDFGQKPDKYTFPFILKACGDLSLVELGRRIHCTVVINGFESDTYVGNCLLAMYFKFGCVEKARLLFDKMPRRDLTSWNTMIAGYVKNGDSKEALVVFYSMQKCGLVLDSATVLGVLSALSDLRLVKYGKQMHGYIVRNLVGCHDNFLINSLIEMYCSCSSMMDARCLFETSEKDTVSWNSMISGYAQNGDASESSRIFRQMIADGKAPDLATFIAVTEASGLRTDLKFGRSLHCLAVLRGFISNIMGATALVSMYSKCGSLACSRLVFDETEEKNLISWTAIISAYGLHGRGEEAVSIFHGMEANNVIPDEGALTSILAACSHAGLVEEGRDLFHLMKQKYNIKPRVAHYACLVDLLSRAGHLDLAYETIENMEAGPTWDIWASLISACRTQQNVTLAELCAQKMLELNPQGVGGYICLSQIYAAEGRWDDVRRLRDLVKHKGLTKPTGCSFIQ